MIYEVNSSTKKPIAKIVHIGSPSQVIDVLSHAVTMPLKQIEIDLEQTPVLRRVYSEKKSIYFRKVPELIAGLIPEVKYQQQIKMVLSQLGITDIAVVPILINGKKFQKEYMIAVLGPLNDDQKKFIKEVSQKFANFYNKQ